MYPDPWTTIHTSPTYQIDQSLHSSENIIPERKEISTSVAFPIPIDAESHLLLPSCQVQVHYCSWVREVVHGLDATVLFQALLIQDAEIRRLEARISAWCADANFAVELGPMASEAHFPINTNYNIQTHFKISDVMAYRILPDAVELKQVVRLGGADAVLTIPMFLFPHHEHIFPEKKSDFDLLEMESAINEAEPTPKQILARKELEKLKKDEASMHVSAHAHLPAQFHQDLLNFVAAIVKATKVIESDKDFEEAKVLRELKRVSTTDSEASSLASVNTNNSEMSQTTLNGNEDKSFKAFLKKVDTGFKEASNKTMVGMRKAGQNTVHAMANDRWIARLVGKVTRKLEKAQGELGYSGEVPIALAKYRERHEFEQKLLP